MKNKSYKLTLALLVFAMVAMVLAGCSLTKQETKQVNKTNELNAAFSKVL
ncbi:MAG: hypothetical protein PHX51_08255 [Clostridia bacterium]|nr:hypothetical protein [Clostridia bacterium]